MIKNLIRKILREEIEFKDLPKGKWSLDVLNYYKSKLPNMPDYVIMDLFQEKYGKENELNLPLNVNQFKDYKWELLKNFPISLEIFDSFSKKRIIDRMGIGGNVSWVPNDEKRHHFQQQEIKLKGIPTEPIILLDKGDGTYMLFEGWHRTIQLLKQFPKGYVYPQVYVGYK